MAESGWDQSSKPIHSVYPSFQMNLFLLFGSPTLSRFASCQRYNRSCLVWFGNVTSFHRRAQPRERLSHDFIVPRHLDKEVDLFHGG